VKPDKHENFVQILEKYARRIALANEYPFEGLYESNWRSIEKNSVLIDDHAFLINPRLYDIPLTELYSSDQMHPLFGSRCIRMLSPELMLLHLALHMTNDCNYWHYNLLDVHELISQKKPNIIETFSVSERCGLGDALYYVLEMSRSNLNTPIQQELLLRFKPNKFRYFFAKLLINHILTLPSVKKKFLQRFKQVAVQIIIMKNTRKIIFVIGTYLKLKYGFKH
jgi:hypothetical protein